MSDIMPCPLCSKKFLGAGNVSAHLLRKADHGLTMAQVYKLGFLPPKAYLTTEIGRRSNIVRSSNGFFVGLSPEIGSGSKRAFVYLITAGQELLELLKDVRCDISIEIFDGEWVGFEVRILTESE